MRGRALHLVIAAAALALVLAACGGAMQAEISSRPVAHDQSLEADSDAATVNSSPPSSLVLPTTAPAPTEPTTTAPPPPGLGVGSEGAAVLTLEQKLTALHYFVGAVDGTFDADTRDAVMAFQKVTGMDRTGRATDDVVAAVNAAQPATPPKALVPAGGAQRVEVDLDRQVLFLYEGNNLDTILPVSTGSNQRFCSEGWCRIAVTPTGAFTVFAQDSGWETGPLGSLYNAQYFNGGIAIHGSPSVPGYPASHGCVRIPMSAAEWFPDKITVGTPVYVVSSDEPLPAPIAAHATPTSTPTTIVPDTVPSTTTTVPNLLSQLLAPPTTRKP